MKASNTLPVLFALALACGSDGDSGSKVSKQNLAIGDPNCPTGGVALTVDGDTSYVCNGGNGTGGAVSLAQLTPGDSHCAPGGVAVSNGTVTNYVCNGAQGDVGGPGPAGGGLYTSRNDVYCNTVEMPNDSSVRGVSASCTSDRDLPLVGSCSSAVVWSGTPSRASAPHLYGNGPQYWDVMRTGTPAQWDCSWMDETGLTINVPGAKAYICCVRAP